MTKRPTLVVVGGPPGSGKTTLAHTIARAIPCPAVCRDEIKEGMVHAEGHADEGPGGPLTMRTLDVFFSLITHLVEARVTLVAEAAFQHHVWAPRLEPLLEPAHLRIVHCVVSATAARERIARRAAEDPAVRTAHADAWLLDAIDRGEVSLGSFEPVSIDAPSITVDTTDGYDPPLETIVAFAAGRPRG